MLRKTRLLRRFWASPRRWGSAPHPAGTYGSRPPSIIHFHFNFLSEPFKKGSPKQRVWLGLRPNYTTRFALRFILHLKARSRRLEDYVFSLIISEVVYCIASCSRSSLRSSLRTRCVLCCSRALLLILLPLDPPKLSADYVSYKLWGFSSPKNEDSSSSRLGLAGGQAQPAATRWRARLDLGWLKDSEAGPKDTVSTLGRFLQLNWAFRL